MVSMYYRGSSGSIIVYDITSKLSFNNVRKWYKDFKEAVPEAAVALIGNKIDLNDKRVIFQQEIEELTKELKFDFVGEVSAKTGESLFYNFFKKKINKIKFI